MIPSPVLLLQRAVSPVHALLAGPEPAPRPLLLGAPMRFDVTAPAPHVDTRPVPTTLLGHVLLESPDPEGRLHVAAASGLTGIRGEALIVADELHQLVRMRTIPGKATLHPGIEPGKKKPDLESVVRIGPRPGAPHGMIMALGSGSKDNQMRGVALLLDASGLPSGLPRTFDAAELFGELNRRLSLQPNIEGQVWRRGPRSGEHELLLMHRGKADGDVNAVFTLNGDAVADAIIGARAIAASAVLTKHNVDLGLLNGVRLGFADGVADAGDGIRFVASAEGPKWRADQRVIGSAIGLLRGPDFELQELRPLVTDRAIKAEGLEHSSLLGRGNHPARYTIVTDADNPRVPAEIREADLS